MIASMTGFGKAISQLTTKKITVEIRSLNSKGLEINVRMPSNYREKELDIRKKLSKTLTRGKVDFSLYIEKTGVDDNITINKPMVKKYIEELQSINGDHGHNLLDIAMRLPESVHTHVEDIDAQEWLEIDKTIDEALKHLLEFREQEGETLLHDFGIRLKNISANLNKVVGLDGERKAELKNRLYQAIEELKAEVDTNRFEQELIYYLEKLDITEEIVRLKSHLNYFDKNLKSKTSNGKKLGFITQEMGREINTIGSKANYAPMQKKVIKMKDELEKIKEQLLNVL
ncbi:MAG: YicC family protein [Flavobacteriales bacterium]|nr:MAG: YicC family protein [Flavobacteriales bacterium]